MGDTKKKVGVQLGMGWLPDYPDFRDFTPDTEKVPAKLQNGGKVSSLKDMTQKLKISKPIKAKLADLVDLTEWCSPIEDQETIGSCTAHAGVGMMEYFERRAFGTHIDASRLFLYKVTRNLLQLTGDTGAFLRTTMGAMALFGVPPEEYWPYVIENYEEEPTAFCYAFGQNYQSLQYFRLDQLGMPTEDLLARIKLFIAAGLPSMFGFTVFSSIDQAWYKGKIPFPCAGDKVEGGHAVMAVGYDDKMEIKNEVSGDKTKGALLIRNSWGVEWGASGYGWLPYDYVIAGLADDWWSLLKSEWVDTNNFGIGTGPSAAKGTKQRKGRRK